MAANLDDLSAYQHIHFTEELYSFVGDAKFEHVNIRFLTKLMKICTESYHLLHEVYGEYIL